MSLSCGLRAVLSTKYVLLLVCVGLDPRGELIPIDLVAEATLYSFMLIGSTAWLD